jgi:hypothetical protein
MLKGVNWVAVIIATVLLEVLGYAWYGVLFVKPWTDGMIAAGITPDPAMNNTLMAIGVVNTLIVVLGLSWLTRKLGATSLTAGVTAALTAWFFFNFTTQVLEYLYMGMTETVVLINMGYQLVSYLIAGVVLGLIKFGAPKVAMA